MGLLEGLNESVPIKASSCAQHQDFQSQQSLPCLLCASRLNSPFLTPATPPQLEPQLEPRLLSPCSLTPHTSHGFAYSPTPAPLSTSLEPPTSQSLVLINNADSGAPELNQRALESALLTVSWCGSQGHPSLRSTALGCLTTTVQAVPGRGAQ